jgi:phage repressor protein C with HTH and peptisase S24 domain
LADGNGLSTSALARRAGLDPTTFNRSKRVTGDGRPRWPSTESLAKVLDATGEELEAFAARMKASDKVPEQADHKVMPVAINDIKRQTGYEPKPLLNKIDWDDQRFPDRKSENEFAVAVSGNGLLPVYREGDILIAQTGTALRIEDRFLVQQPSSPLALYALVKRHPNSLQVRTIGDRPQSVSIAVSAIEWTARIIWASQ